MNRFISTFKYSLILMLISSTLPALAAGINESVESLAEKLTATLEGKVVKVKGNTYYISLGSQDGAVQGAQFEIAREGEPIKVDGKVLGYEEEIIGILTLGRVRKQLSQGHLVGKAKQPLKPGDKVYQKRKQLKRLVIAPFSLNQNTTEFSKTVQEKLITTLVQKGIQVVERSQLEQVLKEQKLTYSGLFNLNSAKQVGQLLGAEGIILGTFSDQGNTVSINARIVDLGSANTIAAAEVELAKTPTIAKGLEQTLDSGYASSGSNSSGGGKAIKGTTKVVDDVKIELTGCKRSGGVVCTFYLTNQAKDGTIHIYGNYSGRTTVAHDNLRNSYTAKTAQLADGKKGLYARYAFDSGIAVRAKIHFPAIDPKADRFVLLNVKLHRTAQSVVKFKNVKIQ